MHSERYFLQFSYLLYKQEKLLLSLQNLLLQPACMQCTAQRQQKAANTSMLESINLLQTAALVFPRPNVCSRLSNNINILAKKIFRPPTGMTPPAPWIRHWACSGDQTVGTSSTRGHNKTTRWTAGRIAAMCTSSHNILISFTQVSSLGVLCTPARTTHLTKPLIHSPESDPQYRKCKSVKWFRNGAVRQKRHKAARSHAPNRWVLLATVWTVQDSRTVVEALATCTSRHAKAVVWASNSLFTPPTRTRQDCLVLSVSVAWTQLETRQDSFVLSRPSFQFPSFE